MRMRKPLKAHNRFYLAALSTINDKAVRPDPSHPFAFSFLCNYSKVPASYFSTS